MSNLSWISSHGPKRLCTNKLVFLPLTIPHDCVACFVCQTLPRTKKLPPRTSYLCGKGRRELPRCSRDCFVPFQPVQLWPAAIKGSSRPPPSKHIQLIPEWGAHRHKKAVPAPPVFVYWKAEPSRWRGAQTTVVVRLTAHLSWKLLPTNILLPPPPPPSSGGKKGCV